MKGGPGDGMFWKQPAAGEKASLQISNLTSAHADMQAGHQQTVSLTQSHNPVTSRSWRGSRRECLWDPGSGAAAVPRGPGPRASEPLSRGGACCTVQGHSTGATGPAAPPTATATPASLSPAGDTSSRAPSAPSPTAQRRAGLPSHSSAPGRARHGQHGKGTERGVRG